MNGSEKNYGRRHLIKMGRLKERDWQEIKKLLQKKNRNITKICKFYGISRHSLYNYAKPRGWIKVKSKKTKRSFLWTYWQKLKEYYFGR
jgi:hypothetical protein